MNRDTYRLVFNAERNAWVAVAEHVRGRGKSTTRRRRAAAVALGLAVATSGGAPAYAGTTPAPNALPQPSANFVFHGSVAGGQPQVSGNNMNIVSTSNTVGLNWSSFNIGSAASVNFQQLSESSRVLNRIWSNDPSQIMGKLTSNGQVYLVNQNGILFGNGSQVNVGGLFASASNLSDSMINQLLNKGLPGAKGDRLEVAWDSLLKTESGAAYNFDNGVITVEAGAKITTPSGGKVILIAPKTVENLGLIESSGGNGEAILAAGGKVILTAPDDPNLRGLLVETQAYKGVDGNGANVSLDGTVTNRSTDPNDKFKGRIDMGTNGVVSLAALAVNQSGYVNATKAVNLNGTKMLVAGETTTDKITVNQRGAVAEIDWVSGFNIERGKSVEFVQSSAGDVAYNFVYDPDRVRVDGTKGTEQSGLGLRSFINGNLTANGQVVLVNEKGIEFGSDAKVLTNSFVASALGMNPNIVNTGLLGQLDVKERAFYLNKEPQVKFNEGEDLELKFASTLAAFRDAKVTVNAGAKIESRENGYVILAGGQVDQKGSIVAGRTNQVGADNNPIYKGGQVVLAAGSDLYLKPGFSSAVRGFTAEVNPLVAIQENKFERDADGNLVKDGDGNPKLIDANNQWVAISREEYNASNRVTNTGTVRADLGDIHIVGHDIVQAGTLQASTSTTMNGSIRLVARDMLNTNGAGAPTVLNSYLRQFDGNGMVKFKESIANAADDNASFIVGIQGGTINFADGSRTAVVIDASDGKTLTGSQVFVKSSIDVVGKNITVGSAELSAKGGNIRIRAANQFAEANAFGVDAVTPSSYGPETGVGIFVADGARIDVSGTNAQKSVSDLFVDVELRGDEFANNPVQRSGALRGQKATVDIRDAVGIADISGWLKGIGMKADEAAATAGTVSLNATGNVVVKSGAKIDVSGGRVDYAAGQVKESLAVAASGQTYRLNDAPTQEVYGGLVTTQRTEAAYVEGKSAGTVEIAGYKVAVDGELRAATTIGTRQRTISENPAADRFARPLGGELILRDAGQHFALADPQTATEAEKQAAFTKAQMVFVRGAANAAAGVNTADQAGEQVQISQSLVDNGFSRFTLTSDGRIDIPADVSLNMQAGGSFAATGRQIYVAGDISAPSGSITLTTTNKSTLGGAFPTIQDAKYSNLIVDSSANLTTAGRWVNDSLDGKTTTQTKAIKGGKVTLNSAYDLDLREGSQVDVSGGAWVDEKGSLRGGDAGAITLASGVGANNDWFNTDSIFLGGKLSAYSLTKGGSLTIQSAKIDFGAPYVADHRAWSIAQRMAAAQTGISLDAGIVDRGGFFDFTFAGRTSLMVGENVKLRPDPVNWSMIGMPDFALQATGTAISSFAKSAVLHPDMRTAPTNITLKTTDKYLNNSTTPSGSMEVKTGAEVAVSPGGTVTLDAGGQLTVRGTIEAPGGSITLTRASNPDGDVGKYSTEKQSESIYLDTGSKLSVAGTTVLTPATRQAVEAGVSGDVLRQQERYFGKVLNGGTVKIDAGLGYVVMRNGAEINVSGASDVLNLPASTGSGITYASQNVGSAGGTVNLAAHAGMFIDGRFHAQGGNGALGGVFALTLSADKAAANPWGIEKPSSSDYSDEQKAVLGARQLSLYQTADGQSHVNLWPAGANSSSKIDPQTFNGKASLDTALLKNGGFGSWLLSSQNEMHFDGKVNATVNNQLVLDAPKFVGNPGSDVTLRAAAAQVGFASDGSTVQDTATTGNGKATISARDIALVGNFSWNGFGTTKFSSDGAIHFDSTKNTPRAGSERIFNGQMTATGALTFAAARLSPSTYSDFRVDLTSDPSGSIAIIRPSGANADVSLSPYGRLEFAATTINHDGTVTAPLGEIVFKGDKVTLGADSVTSVAADRTMLFGNTSESGSQWNFGSQEVNVLPGKGVVVDGKDTAINTGAKINLSGGGDGLATEFTSGPGGKVDILAATDGVFAIVPGWNGFSANDIALQGAYQSVSSAGSSSLKPGDRITLGVNPAGLTGSFVLLPARYAVLPGAYLVTVKSARDAVLAGSIKQADGSWLVSGQRVASNENGSTTAYSATPLTVEVAGGDVVAARAKYVKTTASDFFFDQAGANLAGDAGRLTAIGRDTLKFDPAVTAMRVAEIAVSGGRSRAGRGLELDLAAPKMRISDGSVGGSAIDSSWTVIDQDKLNALGASSVLLGGERRNDGAVTTIKTVADVIEVVNAGLKTSGTVIDKSLSADEVMLTAKNTVTVSKNSRIDSKGNIGERTLNVEGDGAFVRAAEGTQATLSRSQTVSKTTGDLIVEEGAVVAGRSVILDATKDNTLLGDVKIGRRLDDAGNRGSGGAFAVGARRVNVVGDGSAPAEGMSITNAMLNKFVAADQVLLNSYSTVDFYGSAELGKGTGLKELVISSAGLAGHGGGGTTSSIEATSVVFRNTSPEKVTWSTLDNLGSGALNVKADKITFADNATAQQRTSETAGFTVRGFDNVSLTASDDVRFAGTGVTEFNNAGGSGNQTAVTMTAGRVTTVDAADHLLNASGVVAIAGDKGAGTGNGLGGSLELRGKSIDVSGRIETPAGKLALRATGNGATDDVNLYAGAMVAAEGQKVAFADTYAYAPGGSVTLRADKGNINVKSVDKNGNAVTDKDGNEVVAKVSVAADPAGGNAGSLSLLATSGAINATKGSLLASAQSGNSQGDLMVDAKSADLGQLVNAVSGNGSQQFQGNWDIRRRDGSMTLATTLKATNVTLAADNGGITVSTTGAVDVSGNKGGNIDIYTRNGDLVLNGKLIAKGQEFIESANNAGTRGRGGNVTLGVSGTTATGDAKIVTGSQSEIDVSVATKSTANGTVTSAANGGKVNFRAKAPVFDVAGNWKNNLNVSLGGTIIGASDVGVELYRTYAGTSLATGTTSGNKIGLDTLKSNLSSDFSAANVAALRTKLFGSASANASNHVRAGVELGTPSGTNDFTIASDLDFSKLRFAGEAGALTIRASGDLKVNGALNDGFVSVARDAAMNLSGQSWSYTLVAGADSAAANALAVQPSAGGKGSVDVAADKYVRTGTGDIRIAARENIYLKNKGAAIYTSGIGSALDSLADFQPMNFGSSTRKAYFPYGGGNLQLAAGANIEMLASSQRHINEWLWRAEAKESNSVQWIANVGAFQEGVAAFGGGDISVSAGKAIKNLTVAIPTNGRVPKRNGEYQPDEVVIMGGGDLRVRAGSEISKGQYYVETGSLVMDAGAFKSGVAIAMGNTDARVTTTGDLELGNVFNPLWVSGEINQKVTSVSGTGTAITKDSNQLRAARIGTYTDATRLAATTVGGNVTLSATDSFNGAIDSQTGALMPSQVKIAALNGSIGTTSAGVVKQAPGRFGQLDLLAHDNISLEKSNGILQLDTPESLLPGLQNLTDDGTGHQTKLNQPTAREKHASSLWHADDFEHSRLIALNGNISGKNGNTDSDTSRFNEAVLIQAGGNVTNLNLDIQHAHASDTSRIIANGDIKFDTYNPNQTKVTVQTKGIQVGGPGYLEVIAGKGIDLANSRGIVTRGNLDNPYLSEGGASILTMAGLAKADYEGLRNHLGLGNEVSEFELRMEFFKTLKALGTAAQTIGDQSNYEKGRALVEAFLPQAKVSKGDILLSVSQIKTEQDGDIHMLVPDGNIVVGVADPSMTKEASQQGIFTVGKGNVYAYVSKNFLVNQSRVFTLNGGEIVIWSNHGDIDAGSGSKTAVATPPPALVVRNGQLVLDTSNSVAGSGIGVLKSRDDTPAADMSLFAPEGTIDAGDAGLRSTGNITLGARVVLNANNIQAGGAVSGTPAAVAAPAVASVASPTNAENRMLEEAPPAAGNRDSALGILTVEVLGGEECRDKDANGKPCGPG